MFLVCHVVVCIGGLFIGFFGLMMSFGQNIQQKLNNLDENYRIDQNVAKIRSDLYDILKFHWQVKELSKIQWKSFSLSHSLNNTKHISIFIAESSMIFPVSANFQSWRFLFGAYYQFVMPF